MKRVGFLIMFLICQLSFSGENFDAIINAELKIYIQDMAKILSEKKESKNLNMFFPKFAQEDPNFNENLESALNVIEVDRANLIKSLTYITDKQPLLTFYPNKQSNNANASFLLDENIHKSYDINFLYINGHWYIN